VFSFHRTSVVWESFCSLEVDEDSLGHFCVAEAFVAAAIRIIMTLASGRKRF
jgi:hypothetical protein